MRLDLRFAASSAGLLAAIRDGEAHTNPPPGWHFALGDILVVIGAHSEVDAAERLVSGGPAAPPVTAPDRPGP